MPLNDIAPVRCCSQSAMERQISQHIHRRRRLSAHLGFKRPTFAFGDGIPSFDLMGIFLNVECISWFAASIRAAMA